MYAIRSYYAELFGYKAGAFTGAEKSKQGLFAAAEEGTLFLDEIGETSAAFQVRLLRVLEEREFQPLGSVEKIPVNVRVVAATNRDLRITSYNVCYTKLLRSVEITILFPIKILFLQARIE